MTDLKKEREIAENALRAQEYPNIDDHALWVKNLAASGDYIAMAHPARYLELLDTIQDQADTIESMKCCGNCLRYEDICFETGEGELTPRLMFRQDDHMCPNWTPREKE
jgi:hypothetical protein